MGNRWFKTDADYPGHRKVLAVSLAARGMWQSSIAHCFCQESDGWFPTAALRRIADDPTVDEADLARQLVAVGLWHEVKEGALVDGCDHAHCAEVAAGAPDGYVVHDYLDYQPSRAQRAQDRADAADRQRRSRTNRTASASDGGHGPVTRDSGERHTRRRRDTKDRHTDVTRDSSVSHAPVTDGVSRPVTDRGEVSRGEVTGQDASGGGAPAGKPAGTGAAAKDPPPVHVTDDQHPTAQTLLAEYVDACQERPTDRFVKRLGREIKALLDQAVKVAEIRQALNELRRRGRSPSALEAIVNELRNPPEPRPRASPPGAPASAADRHAATRAQTSKAMAAWAATTEGGASP